MGCPYGQGYLLGLPGPLDDVGIRPVSDVTAS